MGLWRVACVVLSLHIFVAAGDTSPCRYEEKYCSCKLGESNQGRCWDEIASKPGFCYQRYCLRGWICACSNRSHVCQRSLQLVNSVIDEFIFEPRAPCKKQIHYQISKPILKLGHFLPSLSRRGMRNDMCTRFTWWHNGLFRGDWSSVGEAMDVNSTNVALKQRAQHDMLELRPGDLLAFQFSQGSYYCYNSFAQIQVNNLNITTNMPRVTTHYARQFSENWFDPSFVLNETNTALNESDPDFTKFLPPRKRMLMDNSSIIPGVDLWERDLGANEDTRTADWFWRIQIPSDLPDPLNLSF